jgi:hypothetical protein
MRIGGIADGGAEDAIRSWIYRADFATGQPAPAAGRGPGTEFDRRVLPEACLQFTDDPHCGIGDRGVLRGDIALSLRSESREPLTLFGQNT